MMPDELPGAVVAVAEVWLDDAYDNITLAQACLAVRREQEEKRIATLGEHPEPPDGETSTEKAQRLWIPRALQQTSYVSRMAQEICDDSTKANWGTWAYREYRRLLDEETMAVCRIYAEVELADLPVREGKEARGWLTSAHQDAERAREHIGEHIRKREGLRALLYPDMEDSSPRSQRRRARGVAFLEAKGANAKPRKQAKEAAARARLQASRATEAPGGSQLAGEADTKTEGTRSGRQRDPTCPRTPNGAEANLVDSTSESDTSDPGGVPQLFRRPRILGACPPKLPRMLPRRQAATRGFAPRPTVVTKPRKRTGGPTLLRKPERKIRIGGATDTGIVLQVARRAREEDNGKVRSEVAVHGAEELPTADARRESPGFRLPQGAGTDSSSIEAGNGDVRAPAPDQPPGESDEFARELASTMSAIASLVIKASGRSVSNGGWLYFNGASKDYRTFRTKCRLFQETYHKATPPMALVKMFREWNLGEDVACRIEGVEDMPAAWRTLDSIYGAPITLTTDQMPEAGWMPEPQEVESGMGLEAGPTSEEEPAPLQARGAAAFRIVDIEAARPAVEAAISPQGKHVFINTPHGIRSLRRLWVRGEEPEHTVVSKEVAQTYGMRADSRLQTTWITGPTGVTVGIDTDFEMFLLVDNLPGRTKRIFAYAVDSVEEYCGLPTGATGEYEIQLGRDHLELLEQLREAQPSRTGARLSECWGETIWRLAAYAESGEHVWITSSGATSRRSRRLHWPPAAGSAAMSQGKDACSRWT